MVSQVTTVLLWLGMLGSGIMAGVYFTFSSFVMQSLARLEPAAAVAAMKSINETILRSAFMPLFFGTSVIALVLVILGGMRWGSQESLLLIMAGGVYVLGMFVCTAAFNVPLNNVLADISLQSTQLVEVWNHYLKVWTRWNHIRTVASIAASAGFALLLIQRSAGS